MASHPPRLELALCLSTALCRGRETGGEKERPEAAGESEQRRWRTRRHGRNEWREEEAGASSIHTLDERPMAILRTHLSAPVALTTKPTEASWKRNIDQETIVLRTCFNSTEGVAYQDGYCCASLKPFASCHGMTALKNGAKCSILFVCIHSSPFGFVLAAGDMVRLESEEGTVMWGASQPQPRRRDKRCSHSPSLRFLSCCCGGKGRHGLDGTGQHGAIPARATAQAVHRKDKGQQRALCSQSRERRRQV